MISRASGCQLPSVERLEAMQILYRRNGRLYGRFGERTGSSIIVSSDFSVMASGRISIPLYLIADPVRSGTVSEWTITKESIRKAIQHGLTGQDIIEALMSHSEEAMPESVASRILSWEEMLSSARAVRCIMLSLNERTARIVSALSPRLKEYMIAEPSQGLMLMDGRHVEAWTTILRSAGVDVIGDVMAEEEEARIIHVFREAKATTLLPTRRAIAFDEALRARLLQSRRSPPPRCGGCRRRSG